MIGSFFEHILPPFGKKKLQCKSKLLFFPTLTAASTCSGVFLETFRSRELKFKVFEMLKRRFFFSVLCLLERVYRRWHQRASGKCYILGNNAYSHSLTHSHPAGKVTLTDDRVFRLQLLSLSCKEPLVKPYFNISGGITAERLCCPLEMVKVIIGVRLFVHQREHEKAHS